MYGSSGGGAALAGTGAGFMLFGHQLTLGLILVLVALMIVTGALVYRRANQGRRYGA